MPFSTLVILRQPEEFCFYQQDPSQAHGDRADERLLSLKKEFLNLPFQTLDDLIMLDYNLIILDKLIT